MELITVLVIIGVTASLVVAGGVFSDTSRDPAGRFDRNTLVIDSARMTSIAEAVAVRVAVPTDSGAIHVLALPDGRVVGAERFGYDVLTGRRMER